MFDMWFPRHWSTLKKLIWLKKTVLSAASWTYKTVTGSLIHILDAIAAPVSALSVDINPVQSGSGDPAPDNICPISGWTQAKVTRTGKNLFEMTLADIKAANTDGTWTGDKYIRYNLEFTFEQENGFVTAVIANGTPTGQANLKLRSTTLPLIKGTSYKLNGCPSGGSVNSYGLWATQSSVTDYGSGATFTADGTTVYSGRIRIVQGTVCNDLTFRPMIRLSADDAAFAPYSGTTLTVDLDGTRYGGTLDVLTGVLTVDMAYLTFDGTDTRGMSAGDTGTAGYKLLAIQLNAYDRPKGKVFASSATVPKLVCNQYKTVSSDAVYVRTQGATATRLGTALRFYDEALQTVDAWTTAMSQTPLQVAYEIDAPITVQLTPQEVSTLLGANNIWADTGDVTVTYRSN